MLLVESIFQPTLESSIQPRSKLIVDQLFGVPALWSLNLDCREMTPLSNGSNTTQ